MTLLLPEAELEAAQAAIWYDEQRARLGDDFLAELQRALDRIHRGPAELPKLESYGGPHDVRRCLLNRFPYLAIFVCRPNSRRGDQPRAPTSPILGRTAGLIIPSFVLAPSPGRLLAGHRELWTIRHVSLCLFPSPLSP